jgi:hypothetical protein
VVDSVRVVVRFCDVKVTFVDSGVLSEPAARLANFSAICADPEAARGGGHGGEMGGESEELGVCDTYEMCA